ncbi:MAG TPA: AraC family transcriptional regulator [Phycisphaerae bacterium]|nr:AraC family transcriptional regulator [Phycisphaerae bacterium]HPS53311.1 AraC family transcriptional regulator [Phycisphaerae bacterium]
MDYSCKNMYYYDMDISPLKIRINNTLLTYCDSKWHWDVSPGGFRDFDLWYVCRGKGFMNLDGNDKKVSDGDCLFLRPDMSIHGTHDPQWPLVVVSVHFDFIGKNGQTIMPASQNLPAKIQNMQESHFFEVLLRRTYDFFSNNRKDAATKYFSVAVHEFFYQETKFQFPPEQERAIDDICRQIIRDPGKRSSVSDLAQTTGYSVDHFSRLFRTIKGTSPKEFIVRARIQAAKGFLKNSNHSIAHIAEILGYNDQFFFSKQFHSWTGQSPRQFRLL